RDRVLQATDPQRPQRHSAACRSRPRARAVHGPVRLRRPGRRRHRLPRETKAGVEERLSDGSGDDELLLDVRNGVATVTLNRPAALNALTFGMLQGLTECMNAWERDRTVKIVV